MLNSILSGDYPRSRLLSVLLLVVFVGLALGPFLFPGTVAYRTMSTILIFIVLVASYDILLGYTSIVSFAHTMFYGIGAYAMAIALREMGPNWGAVSVGLVSGLAVAGVVALLVGLFSLRVKAIFFALVTLAVAAGFLILISKQYAITGGEDGLNLVIPRALGPANNLGTVPGFDLLTFSAVDIRMNGRTIMYYILFVCTTLIFLGLLRMMNSPFGRVCQAIRENEFRAEALGYRTVFFRTINVVVAGMVAAFAGAMTALSVRYVNPETVLHFNLMVNILLITVIGGMGTLYGAVIGATLFIIAQTYLQDLMRIGYTLTNEVPVLHEIINPERWYMWLGILFVLSVYFFPKGIVGQLRIWAANREAKQVEGGNSATVSSNAH